MQTITRQIIDAGLANRVLTEEQLSRLVSGSQQSRYNLVNRAMKAEELIRLQRGIYLLSEKYRDEPLHPFVLAQVLIPGSYVSFETALSHHGWIPEAVFQTASVTPHTKTKELNDPRFWSLSFHPLALRRGYFLELVERQQIDKQTVLIAKPVRALMDLVCFRKEEWQGLAWLIEGLRIDYEKLRTITSADIRTLKLVFKQKRVNTFLEHLARELGND